MRFFAWLLMASLSAVALTAHAQEKPSAAVQREASRAFDEGERAFAKKEYEDALQKFQRAFELVAHDAVRFNIAVCLERLGRYREAVQQYEEAAESQMLGEKDRQRASTAADVARTSLGRLKAKGKAGVSVKVDDKDSCVVPCTLELDPGTHHVAIGTKELDLDVRPGREHVLLAEDDPPRVPKEPPPTRAPRVISERPERDRVTRGPGWLTFTGGVLALVGTGGTVYFGLRTQKLHDDYTTGPTQDRLDDGRRSKLLTNVSIGVIAVGATLMAIDLLILAPQETPKTARFVRGIRF